MRRLYWRQCGCPNFVLGLLIVRDLPSTLRDTRNHDSELLGRREIVKYYNTMGIGTIKANDWVQVAMVHQGLKYLLFGDPSLRLPRNPGRSTKRAPSSTCSGRVLDADANTINDDGTKVQLFGTDANNAPNRVWKYQNVGEGIRPYRERTEPDACWTPISTKSITTGPRSCCAGWTRSAGRIAYGK